MKYKTTKANPIFKEGVILEDNKGCHYITIGKIEKSIVWFSSNVIKEHLQNGHIKEIEEPEFTKSDMIEFGKLCSSEYDKKPVYLFIKYVELKNK